MLELTSAILKHNDLRCGHYAEPFAGGCGLALALLYGGHVAEIHINDIDPAIWSFWHATLNQTEELIELVRSTPVTIAEWQKQRAVHRTPSDHSALELGFATFFLNRTNRSGVIKGGGVIGGLGQTGVYKIDCRYNVDDLVKRIRRVALYRERIHLTRFDALDFLDRCRKLPARSLLFIDPPYFKKGPGLYTSFYKAADHATLAKHVDSIKTPWIVTYDDAAPIRELYDGHAQYSFDIRYSLHEKRTGTELLIAADSVEMPPETSRRQLDRRPRPLAA